MAQKVAFFAPIRVGNSTTCETPGRSTRQLMVVSGEKKTADSFIGREKDS
jgi:hypothetical protein